MNEPRRSVGLFKSYEVRKLSVKFILPKPYMEHLEYLGSNRFDEDVVRLYLHGKISEEAYYYLMTEISPNKQHWKKVFALYPNSSAIKVDARVVATILLAIVVSLILINSKM